MQQLRKVVIIGGCGHVGLPLGIVFANCGLDVVLLDRDQAKIDTVNKGEMPFTETNALERLGRAVTLCLFRGIPTHDATNTFKIYDRVRTAGTSRFRLLKSLPHYLKWYFMAFQPRSRSRGSRKELQPT